MTSSSELSHGFFAQVGTVGAVGAVGADLSCTNALHAAKGGSKWSMSVGIGLALESTAASVLLYVRANIKVSTIEIKRNC